jgi:glycosyltransferase involved in cell wall biosynthesis
MNPQEKCDARFLRLARAASPTVVHLHYQWDYLSKEQQENVRDAVSGASALIVPTKFMLDKMRVLFPETSVFQVLNGISDRLFSNQSKRSRDRFKEERGIPKRANLVGFVGPLENSKGLQILEMICKKVENEQFYLFIQYPDWQAIRDSDVRDRYEQTASRLKSYCPEKIVIWPDRAPRRDDRPICSFDCLLLPSLSEVQPLTMIEAITSGVHVLATRSTPFYGELEGWGVGYVWCRTVPLPERFHEGACERNALSLTPLEADRLSDDFIGVIRDTLVYSEAARRSISTTMMSAGFSEAAMCNAFRSIYAAAELAYSERRPIDAAVSVG